MHQRVLAARAAEELGGAIGEHLVHVHVVRRAGAGLIDVDDELIAKRAAEHLVRRRDDGVGDARRRAGRVRALAWAAAFLMRTVASTSSAVRAQAADREVLDAPAPSECRSRRRRERHARPADRARFGNHRSRSNYTVLMPASFFDSVLALIVQTSTDLPPDVRAAMKIGDGAGDARAHSRRRR